VLIGYDAMYFLQVLVVENPSLTVTLAITGLAFLSTLPHDVCVDVSLLTLALLTFSLDYGIL